MTGSPHLDVDGAYAQRATMRADASPVLAASPLAYRDLTREALLAIDDVNTANGDLRPGEYVQTASLLTALYLRGGNISDVETFVRARLVAEEALEVWMLSFEWRRAS